MRAETRSYLRAVTRGDGGKVHLAPEGGAAYCSGRSMRSVRTFTGTVPSEQLCSKCWKNFISKEALAGALAAVNVVLKEEK